MIRSRVEVAESLSRIEASDWAAAAWAELQALETQDIERLLSNIQADPTWIEEILRRSYTHDNGFEKIVLGTSPTRQLKLRLHVWHGGQSGNARPTGDLNYHNHRWSFVSRVLCGGFRFATYDSVTSGNGLIEHEYRSPEGGTTYSLKQRGPAHLTKRLDFKLRDGTIYYMDHEVIHRVTEPDLPCTATLLVQGPVLKDSTRVFSEGPLQHIDEVGLSTLDPEQLIDFVSRVNTTLKATPLGISRRV